VTVRSIWLAKKPLLLASASPARRAVLEAAGLTVETEAAGIDERAIEASLGKTRPAELAERLAREKASVIALRHPDRVVLGADQVLDYDGQSMSKPADLEEAVRQLTELAGHTHRLHSAVALRVSGQGESVLVETASLTMRQLGETEIRTYLGHVGDAALWSPGGYQVEGLGIHLFERIDGEHTTILGLPMLPLLRRLRTLGLIGI
jgi:septum formation protein